MAHQSPVERSPDQTNPGFLARLKTYLFFALVSLALLVNILAPILAWRWMQLPFLGILTEHTLVVAEIYNPDWPVRSQLSQWGRLRLQAIDGQSVTNSDEQVAILETIAPGETVWLTFQPLSGEDPVSVEVTAGMFPWPDFLNIFGLPYLVGLIYLALGLFVFRLQASRRAGQVFAGFCTLFAIFSGSFFSIYSFHHLTALWTVVLPILAASLVHLALVFPREPKLIRYYPRLRFGIYLPAALLSLNGLYWLYNGGPTGYFLPWRLSFAFIGLCIILFLSSMVYHRLINFSPLIRRQTDIVLVGSLISLGPILAWTGIAAWSGRPTPFTPATYMTIFGATVIFPVAIAYAVLRYQILEVEMVAERIGLHVSLTAVVVGTYVLVVAALRYLFDVPAPATNPVVLITFGLLVIVFLEPLRNWLARLIASFSTESRSDYQAVLQAYAPQLAALSLDIDDILTLFLDQVKNATNAKTLFVFFLDTKENEYIIRISSGIKSQQHIQISYLISDKLPGWLQLKRELLRLNAEGTLITRTPIAQEEIARLAMLGVRVVVPLVGSEKLLGWLAIGDRQSAKPYAKADLAFLANIANQTVIALENAQRFAIADRKTRELMALQETGLDIASEQDTDRILTSVLERGTNLLAAMGGSIFLFDSAHALLNNEICYNLDHEYASISLKPGEGVAGRVAQSGKAKVIKDYRTVWDQVNRYAGENFGSVMAAPLTWKGRVSGVLELIRQRSEPPFNQNDLSLLAILANQAAIALENARLIEEAQDKAAQLQTINEVNRIISATLDRDAALRLITETAVDILGTEAGSIFLVDEGDLTLTFEIALGPTGMQLVGVKMPLNQNSIAGTIAETRAPMVVNNVANDPRWNTSFDEASEFRTRDILGAPMIAFNKVVGVIEVINKQDGRGFDKGDLESLVIFSGQAAIAISNAQRFTQTDKALATRLQELNSLQMIDHELSATLDFQTVLDLTLTRTMDALGTLVGVIGIVDQERSGINFRSMVGVNNKYEIYQTAELWPLTKGVIGAVAATGRPIVTKNGELDNFSGDGRSTSQLCVPVLLKGEVMAVISMEIADEEPFTEQDQEFAMRVANHAALAIQNARLFEAVKSANDAKTEFMSVASHELKIPMTSIKGYAKLLSMVGAANLSDQQLEFLKVINANIDRMDRLVKDLLDVSRIEAGRLTLEMSDVSVERVVNEVIQSVETQIRDKELQLSVDIPPTLPHVQADHGRMVQIMTNLISNAYKYTPKGGKVAVNARLQANGRDDICAGCLSISVVDSGYGISEEDQKSLFNKFFRASDPNIRDEPGTGLGLAITRSLIEMHGGRLWFKSKLGQGSTFGFDLPLPAAPTIEE